MTTRFSSLLRTWPWIGAPLVVVFTLVPRFLDATMRQYGFMLSGLQEVESALERLRIPIVLLDG